MSCILGGRSKITQPGRSRRRPGGSNPESTFFLSNELIKERIASGLLVENVPEY
jgi:hypothetical protein